MRYYLFCRKVIDPDTQDDWDDHLESIISAYRATRHESTGMSPYFLAITRNRDYPLTYNIAPTATSYRLEF